MSGQHHASLAAAQQAGAPTINIGVFLNAVINFLIISFAVFVLVKQVNRFWKKAEAAPPPPAPPTKSDVLLEEIRDLLKDRRA